MKHGKIWGTTETLLTTSMVEVHRIDINPRSQCPLHKHEFKYNMFYVIKGKLHIEVHKNDYDLVDTTTLFQGQYTSVAPHEYHMFKTTDEPAQALEVYYLNEISEDIVRKTVGGINNVD